MNYTVLIPGGFKPMHRGHVGFIQSFLDNPDVEKVIVFVGGKERDGFTQQQTEALIELYGLPKHPKFHYESASERQGKKGVYTNPLVDCYDFAENRHDIKCALGVSSKDKGYLVGFDKYFRGVQDNIVHAPIYTMTEEISATEFREAIRSGDSIQRFLPNGVDEKDVVALLNVK